MGNDWGADCAPPDQECTCGSGSGDPDSCCSKSGPGHGKNTGNYCGNDFHDEACFDLCLCVAPMVLASPRAVRKVRLAILTSLVTAIVRMVFPMVSRIIPNSSCELR